MRNIFDGFDKTDEETIKLASEHYHVLQSEKDRVFAMTERRLNSMKKDNDYEARTRMERMDIETSSRRFPFAAAACITAVVVGAGVFAFINGEKPVDVAAGNEQITYLPMTQDSAGGEASASEIAADVLISGSESKKAMESKAEKKISSEKTESKAEKKISSEKTQSKVQQRYTYEWEISPANEPISQEAESEENISVLPDEESDAPSGSKKGCTVGEDESEVFAPEEVLGEKVYEYEHGVTHSNIVMKVTPDMTYRQVIDLLGEPETYEQSGYAQFIMDGDKLLMLVYDDENDNIGISGEDLAASAYPISEMYSNKDEYTFDAFIIKTNEKGDAFFVVCPQYYYFDCAYVRANGLENEFALIDWLPPCSVRIKHFDSWEESYPVGVDAESIDFYK